MYYPSTAEIEQQIGRYRLHFGPVKDAEVEWRFRAPPFVPAFIELVQQRQKIPAQAEFCDYYVRRNRGILESEFAEKWSSPSTRTDKGLALTARLERAYPSFVRDLYLFALLQETGICVEYHPADDVERGVDLVVHLPNGKLFIHVFLATERATHARAIKERRHLYAGNHMDIVIRPDECKQVGAFWLPSTVHVARVAEQMQDL